MSPTLHMRLLGDFSLVYGDELVPGVNSGRLHSLLAYLVLHNDAPQLRQHLAFLFWPDSSEAQARNNLRQALHQLRHSLPEAAHFLHTDTTTVRWHPDLPFQLDIADFERALEQAHAAEQLDSRRAALEQAARLYCADLLPGCYDPWITPERERLRQRHRQAIKELIALLEALGDYGEAVRHARSLLHDDPLDEESYRGLMYALALNDDRAGAVRVYHACAEALQRELGLEPDQTTREAYERLLQGAAPLAPAARQPPVLDAGLPLIGRRQEWEQLQGAWRHMAAGQPGFTLITGEAGIGKSRLAEELMAWAGQQDAVVAATRSYASEGSLSLAPVTDWLRADGLRSHLARLDPIWLSEVARILPELLVDHPDLPRYPAIVEYGQRQRFFEALARAVLSAPQPLLLLIDDVQWCDQETLEWLHFVLRFEPRARLLVVATMRAEEVPPQHPLRSLLLRLRSIIPVTELELQPMDAAETARLAAQFLRHELHVSAVMKLYRETEGNPLFVVEMVRAGFGTAALPDLLRAEPARDDARPTVSAQPSTLPPKVQAVIAERLAQLSAPARGLVGLAAAIGRAFTLDVLIEAGHADEDSVGHALDELWQKRIVRERGANSYDFTHDKLREVAYSQISAPQRRLLHHHIARALEAIHADDCGPISSQIAAHYEHAGLAVQAIAHYQLAAAVAQRVYAIDDSITLLTRGLALLEQLPPGAKRDAQELNLQLALAPLYRITRGWTSPEVEHVLERAMALCDRVGDDAQRAQVFYGLQSLYVVQARLEKVRLASDELRRLYQWTHSAPPPLEAEMMLTGSQLHLGHLVDASERFERMLATDDPTQMQRIVEKQGWNYAVHGRAWHAHALWLQGYPERALARGREAIRMADALGQPFNQALVATYQAMLLQLCAPEAEAGAQAAEALAITTEYKSPYYRAWAAILSSYALACAQPDASSIARLRAAIDAFKAGGARLRLPYYLGLLASASARAGRADDGLAAIDEAMSAARTHNERWWDAELHRLRGDLLAARGVDAREGEAAYLRALAIARGQQARALELRAATSLARLWHLQGRTDHARHLLGELYAWFTEGFETPDLQAASLLLAGMDASSTRRA
jgi:DNA-binding SARP family transcriptional activator/predicted ATPase